MAVLLDVTGRYLVDDTVDETIQGVVHSEACVAKVVSGVYGNVFLARLGNGAIRQGLLAAIPAGVIVYAATSEEAADVIAAYEEAFPTDTGNVAEHTTQIALDEQITPPDPMAPFFPWDCGVFDMTVEDLSQDSAFLASLYTLFPTVGMRVVILSDEPDLTLAGFVCHKPDLHDGTYVYMFDRFEPGIGLGTADPHGSIFVPGYGWR